MKSRKLLMGCAVAVLLGLGFVLVAAVVGILVIPGLSKPEPEPKGQARAGITSTLVNINLPLNGAELPSGQAVGVYAEAVSGTPVKDLELWVDGVFVPTRTSISPDGQNPFNATWLWTPAEDGNYRLVVRAVGEDDSVTVSNVVRVTVLPAEEIVDMNINTMLTGPIPTPQTPSEDEIPALLESGPQGSETPGGETGSAGELPPGEPEAAEEAVPEPAVPAGIPGAPGLQGLVKQCDAKLLILDNSEDEKNFLLYRLDPGSTVFSLVATIDEHPGTGDFTYIDAGLGLGEYIYYITSFYGSSETPSGLLKLEITEAQCAAASPQAFGLQDAMFTTSKKVDRVYCYLSVDKGPWARIPPGSNEFVYPTAGGFDFGKYLGTLISPPPPEDVLLELECCGWSGNTLEYLGYLEQVIKKGKIELIAGDFTLIGNAVDLVVSKPPSYILASEIAPPYNLEFTRDINVCLARFEGILAQPTAETVCNFMNDGYTTLIWDWIPGCWFEPCPFNVEDIGGFHVYRDAPGMDPVLVQTIINPKIHIAMIPPGSSGGGIIPPKFFVRAYKGSDESMDSPHIQGLSPKYTVILKDPSLKIDYVSAEQGEGGAEIDYYFPETDIDVGYDYGTWEDIGTHVLSRYSDAQVHFKVLEIKKPVTRAVLRWKLKNSHADGNGMAQYFQGCGIVLVDRMSGAVIANPPVALSGEYDVTTVVRFWTQPSDTPTIIKSGFLFVNTMTSLPFSDSYNACLYTLGDFELEVDTE